MIRGLLLASLLMTLAGCAGGAGGWIRSGADGEQASADERRCRNQAAQESRSRFRNETAIMTDRSAGGAPFTSTSPMASLERDRLAGDRTRFNDTAIADCMASQGYARVR